MGYPTWQSYHMLNPFFQQSTKMEGSFVIVVQVNVFGTLLICIRRGQCVLFLHLTIWNTYQRIIYISKQMLGVQLFYIRQTQHHSTFQLWPFSPQTGLADPLWPAGLATVNPRDCSCYRPWVINKTPITCLVPVVCYFNTPFVPRLQSLSVTAINSLPEARTAY